MCRPLHGAAHGTDINTGSDPHTGPDPDTHKNTIMEDTSIRETNLEMERTETYSGIVGYHWPRG
jgi:hypothetical protein